MENEIKHLFIINPAAGKRNRTKEICEKINSLGLTDYAVEITSRAGEAGKLAEKYALRSSGELRIYACGGDGTLFEVVNGIFKYKKCILAPIPIGSGNDFVRGFEDFTNSDFLDLSRLVNGNIRQIDTIDINGVVCINIASVGYDASVVRRMQNFKNLPLVGGGRAYKLSCALCLVDKMKHDFMPIVDGVPIEGEGSYLLSLAANERYYGGGFKAAPLAVDDDGLMDFVRIPRVSRLFFSRFVASFRKGEHLSLDEVKFMRCKTLQFLSSKPLDLNIDGEIISMTNPTLRVKPKSLKIILPKEISAGAFAPELSLIFTCLLQ